MHIVFFLTLSRFSWKSAIVEGVRVNKYSFNNNNNDNNNNNNDNNNNDNNNNNNNVRT